jgi:hypothetical protein
MKKIIILLVLVLVVLFSLSAILIIVENPGNNFQEIETCPLCGGEISDIYTGAKILELWETNPEAFEKSDQVDKKEKTIWGIIIMWTTTILAFLLLIYCLFRLFLEIKKKIDDKKFLKEAKEKYPNPKGKLRILLFEVSPSKENVQIINEIIKMAGLMGKSRHILKVCYRYTETDKWKEGVLSEAILLENTGRYSFRVIREKREPLIALTSEVAPYNIALLNQKTTELKNKISKLEKREEDWKELMKDDAVPAIEELLAIEEDTLVRKATKKVLEKIDIMCKGEE